MPDESRYASNAEAPTVTLTANKHDVATQPTPPDDDAVRHSRAILALVFGPAAERPFDVEYWNGAVERGLGGSSPFMIRVRRPGALRRMLLPPSELSIVEAYLSNDIDIAGDVEAAATLGDAINARLSAAGALLELTPHLLALPKDDGAPAVRAARAKRTVGRAGSKHDAERDQAAIRYHYDVGNDFYALWLDRRMVYSCAFYRTPNESLDDAQVAKLDLVCRKLRLRPGHRLLDVGCGWGALIMHAVQHYGVTALGITLSEAQATLARERIATAGLADRCRVEIRDYRHLLEDQSFDRISSIGMVEHVGVDHLPEYFAALHRALEPGGLLLNHGIVSVNAARPESWRQWLMGRLWRRDAFIDQYVFPDGRLGPLHAVIAAAEGAGFETRDVESLREHYALTLRAWLARLTSHAAEALALTNDRIYRTWRLYMAASAHGFASGSINVVQTLLAKPDATGRVELPLTREDLLRQ